MITKAIAKAINIDMQAALAAVAAKYGLAVKVLGGSLSSTSFAPKVEFQTPDADRAMFAQYAERYMLDADDFGRTFTAGGHSYRVAGVKRNRSKNSILVERLPDNKRFVMPAPQVRLALSHREGIAQ